MILLNEQIKQLETFEKEKSIKQLIKKLHLGILEIDKKIKHDFLVKLVNDTLRLCQEYHIKKENNIYIILFNQISYECFMPFEYHLNSILNNMKNEEDKRIEDFVIAIQTKSHNLIKIKLT